MKKAFLSVFLCGLFILPAMARADFFDSSKGWYMDKSQWTKITDGGGADIGQYTGNPDYLSVTNATGAKGYAEYRSNWGLNMDKDTSFSTKFYYNPGASNTSIRFGLIPTAAAGIHGINISRGSTKEAGGPDIPYFYWELDLSGTHSAFPPETNNLNEGTFLVNYDYTDPLNKKITMSVPGTGLSHEFDLSSIIGPGLEMSVYFGGGSLFDDNPISGNEMYFSNFQFLKGPPVTPEPVSGALFLLGCGALAIKTYRKRK